MQALILAGGSGTRFWPLSRKSRPKQLLALGGERSLLQATVDRLAPLVPAENVWICTTAALREQILAQLPEVPEAQVLCEPTGRNTAPAIAWALGLFPPEKQREVVAVLPADHRFDDAEDFRTTLERAAALVAAENRVVTVGIKPRWAETGYGYLEKGDELGAGAFTVARFRENPMLPPPRPTWTAVATSGMPASSSSMATPCSATSTPANRCWPATSRSSPKTATAPTSFIPCSSRFRSTSR